jgi:hypothetical protein
MRKLSLILLIVVGVFAVDWQAPGFAQAEGQLKVDRKPGEIAPPPKSQQQDEIVRFDDDEGSSGTPCAVPGPCGRCDCPAVPQAVSPVLSKPREPQD